MILKEDSVRNVKRAQCRADVTPSLSPTSVKLLCSPALGFGSFSSPDALTLRARPVALTATIVVAYTHE